MALIATLRFDLNDPDDREAYRQANEASALFSAAWDFGNYLRSGDKYGSEETVAWEGVRAKWHEILDDHDVSLP